MLMIEILGVAMLVVLAVVQKRWRWPALLLILAILALQVRRCGAPTPNDTLPPPIRPVCPHPEVGCTEPGAVPLPRFQRTPDPVCPHPEVGCTEPGATQ